MDLRRTAAYRCLSCGKEWGGWIGPTECPHCGHLYVKWLDYESAAVLKKTTRTLGAALKNLAAR